MSQVHPHDNYVIHRVTLGGKSGVVNLYRLQIHGGVQRQGKNTKRNDRMTKGNRVLYIPKPALGSASTGTGCSWAVSPFF